MRMRQRGMDGGYGYGYGFGGGEMGWQKPYMGWRDDGFPQRRGMGPLREDMGREPYRGGRGQPMQK